MSEENLNVFSFFEKRTVVVIAKTEKEARSIAQAGGGERDCQIEHEVYCVTSANSEAEPTPLPENARTLEEKIETSRAALTKIAEIFADREAYVLMGPRAYISAELIAKTALDILDNSDG